MSIKSAKIQPLDKTVLLEFKIQVADLHLRSKYLAESIAVKVPRTGQFITSDSTVDEANPVTLNKIQAVVAIHSYEPYILDITNASGTVTGIPCTGLFILYGALDSVTIRACPGKTTRLVYLFA